MPGFYNLYVTKEGKAFKIQTDNSLRELKLDIVVTLKETVLILSLLLVLGLMVISVILDVLYLD